MKTTAVVDIICAVFMAILYARYFSVRNVSKSNRQMNICLGLMVLGLIVDALAYTLVGPDYPLALRFLLNLLSFIGSGVVVLAFTFYLKALFSEKTDIKQWLFQVLIFIEFVWIFATAYEFISGHLLTYDANGFENMDYAFPAYIVALNMLILVFQLALTVIYSGKVGKKMAALLCIFELAPILTSVLYSFAGVDFAFAFGAVTLGLVAEFVQKKQTLSLKEAQALVLAQTNQQLEVQQKQLQDALDAASTETKRNDVLTSIVNGVKFTYEISADDEVTAANYSELSKKIFGEEFSGTPMGWIELLHPEDRQRVSDAFMASIRDHTGGTLYSESFRLLAVDGNYRWVRSGGNVIRRADGSGEFYGISLDITEQMEEQETRILGAMPLSNDVLSKANIGLWAFELDEGQPPRMYDDETMLSLVGLDRPVPPEEAYHAWYDNIDEGSYDLVTDAVNKMCAGEHAEVQYPWHYPDGRTIVVRCGGVRNFNYTKGIRIEGTHQDVTQTLHYDEEERQRAIKLANDLVISQLRADSLAYIEDNDPDLDKALDFFGHRILEISGCDQVVYRELDGRRTVINAPGCEDVPKEICARCPFADFSCEAFGKDGIVLMDDCSKGYHGVMAPADCPAKASFMQMIYSGGNLVGKLTVHFLKECHEFKEDSVNIMKTVAIYLGLLIGRVNEKKAELARIAAESASTAKTEFLFNMSHDIRTPMNAILGYTDIALNHVAEPERVNDSLRKIKASGGHLLNLINDILEMSRIEAGKMEIVPAPMNGYAVLESVAAMSRALAAAKDITFEAEVGDLANPYAYADELHTNQVVINLISNAIKYTPPGGTVKYRVEQLGPPVDNIAVYRITISDNGIGMSEEFQKHLFESFSRENTATVSKQEGAGLGLAIVKRILDQIGGSISVKSRQGEGSTFTVDLPLKVMDEAAIAAYKAENEKAVEAAENISFDGRKVLLVEDNEMNREIATEILTEAGLQVETAADGSLALAAVKEKGTGYYDFILMDIQMPILNGYEATAAIRKLPGGDAVPIIALSANAFEEDKKKSLANGMNAHIAKPIDVKNLFETIQAFVK